MVKLKSISSGTLQAPNCVTAKLFADQKSEVTAGMTIVGLPVGCTLDIGSSVMTAAGDIAFLKSDGTWNWV
jgi:hypothetical protein